MERLKLIEGAYKTTWFSYLLPPELRRYFRIKTNAGRMNKGDLLLDIGFSQVRICQDDFGKNRYIIAEF